MFVCLCGGGLFIYYVNSCSFFADFSIKSFSKKNADSESSEIVPTSPVIVTVIRFCVYFNILIVLIKGSVSKIPTQCSDLIF